MLVLALVSALAAGVDAGPVSFTAPASSTEWAHPAAKLLDKSGNERVRISPTECDDAGDVGRRFDFDGEHFVCSPEPSGGFAWRATVAPTTAAVDAPPPAPIFSPILVWTIVTIVLTFGFGMGSMWLHSTATRERPTNPVLADAMDAMGDELLKLKATLTPHGVAPQDVGVVLHDVFDAFFNAHVVATGAPHPSDPRAP